MGTPRAIQGLFLVVLALFIAASLNHTSTQPFSSKSRQKKASSSLFQQTQQPWSLGRLKPPIFAGVRQRLERSETMWEKSVERRHKLLEDYTDPKKKDMFPARGPANYDITPFTIWDFVTASFNCPYEIERIGRLGDGGKWICGLSRYEQSSKPCIVYSFGIQWESSFEEELLERAPNCELWGYDPSVNEFGPQLKTKMKGRAHFTKAGISGKTDKSQTPPYFTISDLIEMNEHSHVDIMKIDIEGAEFDALTTLVRDFEDSEIPIGQILIEIHLDPGRMGVDGFLKWWELLEDVGYRAAWTEPNLLTVTLPLADGMPRYSEYTLINVKDSHNLVLS